MFNLKSHKLLAGALTLALGVSSAAPVMADTLPVLNNNTPALSQSYLQITAQNLPQYLAGMGYNVTKTVDDGAGGNICTIAVKDQGWTFVFDVSVSGSGKNLWFAAILDQVPDGVPASVFKAILDKNDTITPASFSVSATTGHLNLNMPVDNQTLTQTVFAADLSYLMNLARDNRDLWDMSKFTAANNTPPVNPTPAPANNLPGLENPPVNTPVNNTPSNNLPGLQNGPVNTPVANGPGGYRLAR